MNYTFHPHAEKELEQIEDHYDNIREVLGKRFRNEIRTTISRILNSQMAGHRCRQLFVTVD